MIRAKGRGQRAKGGKREEVRGEVRGKRFAAY
jgi:hypothetical protein